MLPPAKDIPRTSSIDEHVIWQKHREIMATLVRQGNRRPFAENTGVPPPHRDLPSSGFASGGGHQQAAA